MEQVGNAATKVVDRWSWWRTALSDPDKIGKSLPVHESEPQQGYYRVRTKGGDWQPVAIFYPDGSDDLVAYRNNREVSEVHSLWTWCCRNPISYDVYQKALAGEPWQDEPPPAMGHNLPDDADPFEALKIELLGETETASEFLQKPVETQEQADKLGIWARRVGDIATRADDRRKVEKQPHWDAGKRVDEKWREIIDPAKQLAADLKKAVEPYLKEKKRKERERAEQAAREAERLRRELQEREIDEETRAAELQKVKAAEDAAKERNASAGRTGSKVFIRTVKKGKVTDYGKAATALVALKHPDMISMIDTLANRAARSGVPFDGMEIIEEETV